MTESSVKSLLSLFIRLDFRDKKNSGRKKFTGILIAYLFSNTILSFNFYTFFNERSYIILTLTSNIFLFAMLVLNDFDNLFLGARNRDILLSLPLKSRDLFVSKFLSALFFLMFFLISATIPQIVFFHLISNDILKTALYLSANLLFGFSAAGIITIIYSLILIYFPKRAGLMLNLFQILFFIFIFIASSISAGIKKPALSSLKINILEKDIASRLPQTFFSLTVYEPVLIIFCILITLTVYVFLYYFLNKKYSVMLANAESLLKSKSTAADKFKSGFLSEYTGRFILKDKFEKASYNLAKNQLNNSRFLKTKYFPVALIPLIMASVGLISGIPELIYFKGNSESSDFVNTVILLMSPSITLTLMISSKMLISNTKILDENTYGTEWIYDSLPISDKGKIISGTAKFVYLRFILPVTALIFLIVLTTSDLKTAVMNILYVSSGIYFLITVSSLFDRTYPFTLESTKFNSASKFLEVFIAMASGMILFFIQIFVFQNIIFVIISVLIFTLISILLNRN